MEMRKILIADESEEFAAALCEELRGICCVRACREGHQALDMLRSFEPDLLVLDLMLPGLDGISLLQMAARDGLSVNVLATTSFVSPYVTDAVQRLGVSYLMLKPCALDAVLARIDDLVACAPMPVVSAPDTRNTVSNILITLRIPTKLRGYACAREAVLCLMRDPGMSITKELYPMVASRCDGTPVQVERAIRGAIQAAWSSRDETVWRRYFQPGPDGTVQRPSNAGFLSRIADLLLMEHEGRWEDVAV